MTFIKDYMAHMEDMTDAPSEYHHAVALTLLSTILNRNVYLDLKMGRVYPNLWTLLLGESSLTRKSTATKLGVERILPENVKVAPNDSTPEGFIDYLSDTPHTLFYRDEFGGFLADLNRRYMQGMKEFLCYLYDCPNTYTRHLKKKSYVISDTYISILSSTTNSRFSSLMSIDDILSGFCPRFLLVAGDKSGNWKGIEEKQNIDVFKDETLKKQLRKIKNEYQRNTAMKLPTDTMNRFNDWLYIFELKSKEEPDELKPFYSRLSWYALKFAMIFSAEKFKHSIDIDTIDKATEYAGKYMRIAKTVVSWITDIQIKTRTTTVIDKIKCMIKDNVEIDHRKLLQYSHITAKELKEVIKTLKERGEVREVERGRAKWYVWINQS